MVCAAFVPTEKIPPPYNKEKPEQSSRLFFNKIKKAQKKTRRGNNNQNACVSAMN